MPLSQAVDMMRSSGLGPDDVIRLTWLRYQVRTGKRTEVPMEHKRLLFFRYLHECGLIQG